MPTYLITVPGWHPASVNRLIRLHWSSRNNVLKADAEMVAVYARFAEVPSARGRRRVTFTFVAPGGRGAKAGDLDNRLKSGLDALVRCGLLVDDTSLSCEWVVLSLKGPKATVIELEDLSE